MKNKLFLYLLTSIGIVFCLSASSPLPKELMVVSSKIGFKIKNFGLTVDGDFSGLKANIKFDPKNLQESSISASIEVNTIDTGNKTRDKHLCSDDYFDFQKYPTIQMVSTGFTRSPVGEFVGTFDVTIKDVTKNMVIPFRFKDNVFESSFVVNRLDFNVGRPVAVLSEKATVEIAVVVK